MSPLFAGPLAWGKACAGMRGGLIFVLMRSTASRSADEPGKRHHQPARPNSVRIHHDVHRDIVAGFRARGYRRIPEDAVDVAWDVCSPGAADRGDSRSAAPDTGFDDFEVSWPFGPAGNRRRRAIVFASEDVTVSREMISLSISCPAVARFPCEASPPLQVAFVLGEGPSPFGLPKSLDLPDIDGSRPSCPLNM